MPNIYAMAPADGAFCPSQIEFGYTNRAIGHYACPDIGQHFAHVAVSREALLSETADWIMGLLDNGVGRFLERSEDDPLYQAELDRARLLDMAEMFRNLNDADPLNLELDQELDDHLFRHLQPEGYECPACGKIMDRACFERKLDQFQGSQRCEDTGCDGAWCSEDDLDAAREKLNATT